MAERSINEDQLARLVEAVVTAMKPMFETLIDRIEEMERRQPAGKSRMSIKTAAKIYDVNPTTLQLWCLRGDIPGAKKVGKSWSVPREGMEQVFVVEGRKKRGRWS